MELLTYIVAAAIILALLEWGLGVGAIKTRLADAEGRIADLEERLEEIETQAPVSADDDNWEDV